MLFNGLGFSDRSTRRGVSLASSLAFPSDNSVERPSLAWKADVLRSDSVT